MYILDIGTQIDNELQNTLNLDALAVYSQEVLLSSYHPQKLRRAVRRELTLEAKGSFPLGSESAVGDQIGPLAHPA